MQCLWPFSSPFVDTLYLLYLVLCMTVVTDDLCTQIRLLKICKFHCSFSLLERKTRFGELLLVTHMDMHTIHDYTMNKSYFLSFN